MKLNICVASVPKDSTFLIATRKRSFGKEDLVNSRSVLFNSTYSSSFPQHALREHTNQVSATQYVVFVLKTQIQTTQDCSALVTQDITEHKKTTSMENAQVSILPELSSYRVLSTSTNKWFLLFLINIKVLIHVDLLNSIHPCFVKRGSGI